MSFSGQRFVEAALLSGLLGCDTAPEEPCAADMPSGWICAHSRTLTMRDPPPETALCATPDPLPEASGAFRMDAGETWLDLSAVQFREGHEQCAYAEVTEATLRVLVQACDMRPDLASKGSCYYYPSVALGELGPELVEVAAYARSDFHGGDMPPLRHVGTFPIVR